MEVAWVANDIKIFYKAIDWGRGVYVVRMRNASTCLFSVMAVALPSYSRVLYAAARHRGLSLDYSRPELVNGGNCPPPSRIYPGQMCYMITIVVTGGPAKEEYHGFGPAPGIARRAAESKAYKALTSRSSEDVRAPDPRLDDRMSPSDSETEVEAAILPPVRAGITGGGRSDKGQPQQGSTPLQCPAKTDAQYQNRSLVPCSSPSTHMASEQQRGSGTNQDQECHGEPRQGSQGLLVRAFNDRMDCFCGDNKPKLPSTGGGSTAERQVCTCCECPWAIFLKTAVRVVSRLIMGSSV